MSEYDKKWRRITNVAFAAAAATIMWATFSTPAAAQNKSAWGTIIGGASGGYLGSRIGKGNGRLAAIAGGTLLGAIFGNSVGRSLDRADAAYGSQTYGSPYGYGNRRVRPHWNQQNVSHPYARRYARPQVRSHYIQPRSRCASNYTREYQTVVIVGGREVPAFGTACYMPDGSWKKM